MIKYLALMLAIFGAAVALSACGGGGGSPVDVRPESVDPPVISSGESLSLPSGHGLSAGAIRVPPGGSVEHGNVVVSCPTGGPGCVVTVAADGTASYDRTGGVPKVLAWGYSRDNPTAEDLLDHWNDPETLRSALGLTAVSQSVITARKRSLKALLDSVSAGPGNAGVRFRNARLEDVEIIGEENGITYGYWKGGPAGTLNIEFDLRFIPDYDTVAMRAGLEREGKLWSSRLQDDFGQHVVRSGSDFSERHPLLEYVLDEDATADDIRVFVFGGEEVGFASGGARFANESKDDYEPWLGFIIYHDEALATISNHLRLDPTSRVAAAAHELGHVLGIDAHVLAGPIRKPYVNYQNHTFVGPEAMRANGGEPVEFQWHIIGEISEIVAPRAPGATYDYGHLGACNSLMSYGASCRHEEGEFSPNEPTDLDFAVLADIGYETLDAATASEPEVYGWGAWGQYSGWGVGVERNLRLSEDGTFFKDHLRAGADAFGISPPGSLGENAGLSGMATWSGSLVGVDLGRNMLPPVVGDAEVQVDLTSLDGRARFNNLTAFVENQPAPFRSPNISYAIEVTGNSFSDAGGYVNGSFYGPDHEEVAGVLNDRNSGVNLLAGFGGKR